ncbi:GNAT family N-acetyltransferase, partial [Streptomyces antimycoticus]|uniref:GNAT family N-acetyltransferase n=1 Tax=Streptomyces antimycoticus TaxID=68175 RepID=UPI00382521AB
RGLDGLGLRHVLTGHRCILHDWELHRTIYSPGPGLVDQVPAGARTERLMGLCELAVRPPWQSQGIGSRLHAELLKTIAPKWSSLLALPSNRRGQDLYARLGYEYAGLYRNTADGPEFDLLLLQVEESVRVPVSEPRGRVCPDQESKRAEAGDR